MKRKVAFVITLAFLLVTLNVVFNFGKAEASGSIYIGTDGSITPSTAPISTVDNITFTFTGNITSNADGIVIERDNIVLDGAGYTLQGGVGSNNGIALSGIKNVSVKNTNIIGFLTGISLFFSSNNTVSGNNVTNNTSGIYLSSLFNTPPCSNNLISGNSIANSIHGISLYRSSGNTVSGNNITNNGRGILLDPLSSNNIVYHNSFINNTAQVLSYSSDFVNVWDDGYPSGGNTWSDYYSRYPNASEIDSSGIWNTPYIIDLNNIDRYPLMTPHVIPASGPISIKTDGSARRSDRTKNSARK